eukprot:Skav205268  [mRNA]  locus=scaffold1841:171779:175489:- [translate_table: standard]
MELELVVAVEKLPFEFAKRQLDWIRPTLGLLTPRRRDEHDVCEVRSSPTAELFGFCRKLCCGKASRRVVECVVHVMPSALQAGLQPGAHLDLRSPNTKMSPSSTSSPSEGKEKKERGEKGDNAVVLQLAKTKMCAFFERGKCSSDTCRYAHSPSELRRPPNLQKTKLCKAFLQGKCKDGENCSFAHGDADLRVTAGIYKTQMCNFYERGHCKKGDRCNHAHGNADLRPMIPSPQKTPVRHEKGCVGALQTPEARTPPKVEQQGEPAAPAVAL